MTTSELRCKISCSKKVAVMRLIAIGPAPVRVRFLLLIFVLLPMADALFSASPAAAQDKSATPSAALSFDHTVLREDDFAQVEVWFLNSSDRKMKVSLTISGTDNIQWHSGACNGSGSKDLPVIPGPLDLGMVDASAAIHRSLCATVKSVVYVGDYNQFFVFEYHVDTPPSAGLLAVEKTVKLTFLGTDNIAGIPLAFACFILPGFCFWLTAQALGAFEGMGTGLGDKTIYSILVSMVIVWASSVLSRWFSSFSSFGGSMNLAFGVSIAKLLFLSAIGAVAGLVPGGWVYLRKRFQAREQERWKIRFDEQSTQVLEKLLHQHPDWNNVKTTVTLKNGEQYFGSLYAQADTNTGLLGWFQLQVPAAERKVNELETGNKWASILEWARARGITATEYRPIRTKAADKAEHDEGSYLKSWRNDEIAGVDVAFKQTRAALELVRT